MEIWWSSVSRCRYIMIISKRIALSKLPSFSNSRNLKNKRTFFIPVILVHEKCVLNCRPKGVNLLKRWADKVVDGTTCTVDSYDICVDGRCEVWVTDFSWHLMRGRVSSSDLSTRRVTIKCWKISGQTNGAFPESSLKQFLARYLIKIRCKCAMHCSHEHTYDVNIPYTVDPC